MSTLFKWTKIVSTHLINLQSECLYDKNYFSCRDKYSLIVLYEENNFIWFGKC